MLVCWCKLVYDCIEPWWICWAFVHERTMVSTGFLAQASMARLREINRGSLKMFHASGRSGEPRCSWESDHLPQARGVSPKRVPVWATVPLFRSLA